MIGRHVPADERNAADILCWDLHARMLGKPLHALLGTVRAKAGAISQCSTDVYITGGLTHALRMIEYARSHPPLVINLHWAWMPHAHLAMACEEKAMPLAEFPMGEDFPNSLLDGPHLLAPDWPGIYRVDGIA